MKNQPKKIAVLTSGGDAPGMNAALRAVVRSSVYYGIECYAIHQGYQGLIDNEFDLMNARSVNNIINKGGTIISSCSLSWSSELLRDAKLAYENLKKAAIDALVVIGGDGSFTGAMIFQEEHNFPVVGIPGTIDNDIFGTRYTLGYDTAINTVVEAIDKIRDTASSHNRLFLC